ncbi:MAG: flagellar assembly peptidoglycan hydrolase FlgJ [Betaproteobacteria bacterium]
MNALGKDVTASFALDTGALSALREQAKTSPGKALNAAATQFEAVFLQMMMKSMRDALPQDGPLDSEATKMYTSMFDQQITMTLAKRGTGLSKVIESQLSRALPKTPEELKAAAASPTAHAVPARANAAGAYARTAASPANGLPLKAAPHPTTMPASADKTSWLGDGIRGFVDKLRPAAEVAAKAIGLPVEYLLAQAGLETGWGKHQPKDAANSDSHNLFGIKATSAWKGKVVEAATHEVVAGTPVRTHAKFRSYDSYASAFGDFAKMIGSSRRYAPALAHANDPQAYAVALQKGGYATDPAYAAKLTRAIRSVTPLVEARARSPIQVTAHAADIESVRA